MAGKLFVDIFMLIFLSSWTRIVGFSDLEIFYAKTLQITSKLKNVVLTLVHTMD